MAFKVWLCFILPLLSAIGFLCSQLFHILQREQQDMQPNILRSELQARHSGNKAQAQLEGQKDFNTDARHHKDENTGKWIYFENALWLSFVWCLLSWVFSSRVIPAGKGQPSSVPPTQSSPLHALPRPCQPKAQPPQVGTC